MRSARRQLGAGVALIAIPVVLATGCSAFAESAHTGGGSGGRPAADSLTPAATTTRSLPPRPREIRLDRVDPCQILTGTKRRKLGYDRPTRQSTETRFGNARACSFGNSAQAVDAQFALVTSTGIGVWTDGTAQVDTEQVTIAGFPGLIVRTPGIEDACNVEVDVAEGQFLDVLADTGGRQNGPTQQVFCQQAQTLAEAAMTSLEAG